jgi:hypothetical protein
MTRSDSHAFPVSNRTSDLRLTSDDPAIAALEQSLHELALHERANLDAEAMDRIAMSSMQQARAQPHTEQPFLMSTAAARTTSGGLSGRATRVPYRMAAMLAMGALGTLAALVAQRGFSTRVPMLSGPVQSNAATRPHALPTDVEWDLVDGALASAGLQGGTSDSVNELWNDADTLQQQWMDGSSWYDDGVEGSAS